MSRSVNDSRREPDGVHWGQYSATSALPGTAAGQSNPRLALGDLASVLGELYVCTSPAPGAATWALVSTSAATTALTAGRVPYVTTGGDLKDEAALTYTEASDTLTAGAVTVATGDLTVTLGDAIVSAGDVTVTLGGVAAPAGDLSALGGFRMLAGPFTAPGAAGVTAAGQTNLDLYLVHIAGTSSFVATRAGSIMGLSGQLSEALTDGGGGDQTLTIAATKNGTEVALTVAFTVAVGEVKGYSVAAKDALTFAAGDVLGVSYTSNTITNTPTLTASLEIEM